MQSVTWALHVMLPLGELGRGGHKEVCHGEKIKFFQGLLNHGGVRTGKPRICGHHHHGLHGVGVAVDNGIPQRGRVRGGPGRS